MTTGATAPCSYRDPETGILITGCTATTKFLVPKSGMTYITGITSHDINMSVLSGYTVQFLICLTQDAEDIGFFDAYTVDTPFDYINITGVTSGLTKFEQVLSGEITLAASGLPIVADSGYITGTTIPYTTYLVTGSSSSRLTELRKYTITNVFQQQYVSGGTYLTDGVDYAHSVSGKSITYYLGGIKYLDTYTGITTGTTFRFTTSGMTNNPNFINKPIYKNMNKENIISNPKIYDDVFIIRQEFSAFDGNYRLEYIQSLVDLETYAGGKFFNIINNT